MEYVVFSSAINHLKSINSLHRHQQSFGRSFSCEMQSVHFIHDIQSNTENGCHTDATFLDFLKAFDRVLYRHLMYELASFKHDPSIIEWIPKFLNSRSQYTVLNNTESTCRNVTSDMLQGSVLGRLLFVIHINDLSVFSCIIHLFANVCVIYRPVISSNYPQLLQNNLSLISDQCILWQMSLILDKCKVLIFSRSPPHISRPYFHDTLLTSCSSCKYLGVHLTNDLSWQTHIRSIISKSCKTLGYLRRTLKLAPSRAKHCMQKNCLSHTGPT